jgi:mRNA interferase HicA
LQIEQKCSRIEDVKGSEFLRKVKAVAKRRRLTCRWVPERGSGSHGTLYVGERFTVVKDLKKELGLGLLSDMLKQLGIRKEDL